MHDRAPPAGDPRPERKRTRGIIGAMTTHRAVSAPIDNTGESDYPKKIAEIAAALRDWSGPVVLASHVDPDGDALGSTLALKRALDALGKRTTLVLEPPSYLAFLAAPGELSAPLERLPAGCLLAILDVAESGRVEGVPLEGAAFTLNVDHHGTNDRFGDLALVEPDKAATALIVKDVIDRLPLAWTPEIATPCLTGLITDTGNFRYGNTSREVLEAAGALVEVGVDYAGLTDRLQWRHPSYFTMLGRVMSTVDFSLDGQLVTAEVTEAMREGLDGEDDSDDFVGLIRYAQGTRVAALLKERDGAVKLSVRTRDGVSAQAICVELGGGGHVAAAGAKVEGDLAHAYERLRAATRRELERKGFL